MSTQENNEAPLTFSLKRKIIPIILLGDDGTEEKCQLIELDGKERDSYLSLTNRRLKYINGKASGVKNLDGYQSCLLTRCLIHANEENFTEEEIQKFPAAVVNQLHDKAEEINALSKVGEEQAKND